MTELRRSGWLLWVVVSFIGGCKGCKPPVGITGDKCAKVTCPTGQTCNPSDGTCAKTVVVAPLPCDPQNQTGACPSGSTCDEGVCYADSAQPPPCSASVNGVCPNNEACLSGTCTAIDPSKACSASLITGECPGGQICVLGDCYANNNIACSGSRPDGFCAPTQACVNGVCTAMTPTCSSTTPTGTCSSWEVCADGQCAGPVPPDACSATNLAGSCPAADVCVSGTCTPIDASNECSPQNQLGLCPTGAACNNGTCIEIDPGNQCNSTNPNGLCPSGGTCRSGTCVPTACQNGGESCPVGERCSSFTCVPVPCDPTNASGQCADTTEHCDGGVCVGPQCTDTGAQCQTGFYCNSGSCDPVTCSNTNKTGTCPANQQCINGACTKINCNAAGTPANYCGSLVCDPASGTCVPGVCSPTDPTGNCPPDEVCIGGSCSVPNCSSTYPGGLCPTAATPTDACLGAPASCCPSGQNCVCANGACEVPPCSVNNPNGACPDPSDRICCNTALQGARTPECILGQCTKNDCGPASAGKSPTGYCPTLANGQGGCTDPNGCAFSCIDSGSGPTCQLPFCSTTFPSAACSAAHGQDPNDVCYDGTCFPRCASGAPGGACGAGFACINQPTQITPPVACTVGPPQAGCSGSDQCIGGFCYVTSACTPACVVNGTLDSDCDHISDKDEGFDPTSTPAACAVDNDCPAGPKPLAVSTYRCTFDGTSGTGGAVAKHCYLDTDGDGTIDAFDLDSDGDGISDSIEAGDPDPATPPANTDGDAWANFRDLDSDGDFISDTLEAKTVSAPVDSDGDGIPDYLDSDSDNDGIPDRCEAVEPSGALTDTCQNTTLVTSVLQLANTDQLLAAAGKIPMSAADAKPDYLDADSDGDGVPDMIEARARPWDPSSVTTPPPNHDAGLPNADLMPDYRDLDSDGDGVPDSQEDKNGNGIVDCQLSGNGAVVADVRPSPACGSSFSDHGVSFTYDYNPGCPTQKCMLAETSRVVPDTDDNGFDDGQDGIFEVCSTANLKPINVFYSPVVDYSLALEQEYNSVGKLTSGGNEVGLLFDDTNTAAGTINGSNAVSGFIVRRQADATALTATDPVHARALIAKAIAQEAADRARIAIKATSGLATVALVITRNFTSFDGYGVVISRYTVTTSANTPTSTVRDNVLKALALCGANGYGACPETLAGFPATPNGPSATNFTITTETLYRYDTSTVATSPTPASEVLVLGAVTESGTTDTLGYNYRSQCTDPTHQTAVACGARQGCTWTGTQCLDRSTAFAAACSAHTTPGVGDGGLTACQADTSGPGGTDPCLWRPTSQTCVADPYQIPLFYTDNITNSSELAQYGDDLGALCQSFSQGNPVLDFLWGIDDSGSMSIKIGSVLTSSSLFIKLLNNTEADYRVAQTTTARNVTNDYEPSYAFTNEETRSTTASPPSSHLIPTNGSLSGDFTGAIGGVVNPASADRTVSYQCPASTAPTRNGADAVHAPKFYDSLCTTTNQATCTSFTGCHWNGASCEINFANACPACATNLGGTVTDAQCYFASNLPDDSGSGEEYSLLMPEWAIYRASGDVVCKQLSDATTCGAQAGCVWNGTSCGETYCGSTYDACEQYTSHDSCGAVGGCVWNSEHESDALASSAEPLGVCMSASAANTTCFGLLTNATCNGNTACIWQDGSCFSKAIPTTPTARTVSCGGPTTTPCSTYRRTTSNECTATNACTWVKVFGESINNGTNSNMDDCVSNGCVAHFNATKLAASQTACSADTNCRWVNGTDHGGTAHPYCADKLPPNPTCQDYAYTDPATCAAAFGGATPVCTWETKSLNGPAGSANKDISPDCVSTVCHAANVTNAYTSTANAQTGCNNTAGCRAKAIGAYGSGQTYCQDQYDANPELADDMPSCQWNPDTNVCTPSIGAKCYAQRTQGACAGQPNCSWDGTQCVPQAVNHTVLCQAPDQSSCQALPYYQGPSGTASKFCIWDNGFGTTPYCHPPLKRSFRPNATKGLIIMTDEETCDFKDRDGDGQCGGAVTQTDALLYSSPQRASRSHAYQDFYRSHGFTVFGIVGDKADTSKAPAAAAGNGGCNVAGTNAEAVNAVIDTVEATGGGWGSICGDPNTLYMYSTIEAMIISILGKASPYKLDGFINGVAVQPISSTIEVAVQTCKVASEYPGCASGTVVTVVPRSRDNGWDYDTTDNTIILYGSARSFPGGVITASYRYWINNPEPPTGNSCGSCGGTFPACTCSEGVCGPEGNPGTCGAHGTSSSCTGAGCTWVASLSQCISNCSDLSGAANCAAQPGCAFETALNTCVTSGVCAIDPTCGGGCAVAGDICNPSTGQCECDTPCGGTCSVNHVCAIPNPIPAGTCGSCVCDTTCGGGCGTGKVCNGCGVCQCDTTCGGITCPGVDTCDKNTASADCGLCVPPTCGHCPDTFICDTGSGFCVCDTNCGGGCPAGTTCDKTPSDATCGQCLCDTTCGGGCTAPDICESNPAKANCGLCHAPVVCPTCPGGQICNDQGQCVIDPTCGGCQSGYACNTLTGMCQPASCPADSRPATECTANNLSCCSGAEGTSFSDADRDGALDCNSACGAAEAQCSVQGCDCNDSDPAIGACSSPGQTCDTVNHICVAHACPMITATSSPPGCTAGSPGCVSGCTTGNLSCCTLAANDHDGDGLMDCASSCGALEDACKFQACDCNDSDPSIGACATGHTCNTGTHTCN